jgi:drug/metabolite transporter (DMT)-like permease
MLFLFIIRRLNPRGRAILGAAVTLVGLALLGLAATVASWLVVHGIITTALGAAFCVAAYVGHKRAQAAHEVPASTRDTTAVSC